MTRTLFGPGARGDIVRRLQLALRDAQPCFLDADGIFGQQTAAALSSFQQARQLPSTGLLDVDTCSLLAPGLLPSLEERCLQLTAAIEGHGYTVAIGNSDGAWLTWGIIGFTLKFGQVQRILAAIAAIAPALIPAAFGALAPELLATMRSPAAAQRRWAESISTPGGDLLSGWRDAFARFGEMPLVQQEQRRLAHDHYFVPALAAAPSSAFAPSLAPRSASISTCRTAGSSHAPALSCATALPPPRPPANAICGAPSRMWSPTPPFPDSATTCAPANWRSPPGPALSTVCNSSLKIGAWPRLPPLSLPTPPPVPPHAPEGCAFHPHARTLSRSRSRMSRPRPSAPAFRFRKALLLLAALGASLACADLLAQQAPSPPDYSRIFDKHDVMIPARDGVRLHTEIYTPRDAAAPLPFILERTPYGTSDDEKGFSRRLGPYDDMVREGYIFVIQDIRGRFKSEGKFVMNRPPRDRSQPNSIDEGTDTYDTIDWLIKHVPRNNGRVGQLGISYGGWLTTMSLLEPHPALKAVSEQASPEDQFLGDDFHHNGAFRLSYGFEYATMMETDKENFSFRFDKYDTFQWYYDLGALSNVNARYLHGTLPTWNDFVEHPDYDSFWQKLAFWPYLKNTTVPDLNVAGWWDQEDFYGPVKIYELLENNDARGLNYLVVGPWNHGGWARGPGRSLGPIDFGSDTGAYFRANVQAPWFAYWLKDKGKLPLREALAFETGSNRWRRFDQWPPRDNVQKRKLYLRENSALAFDPPPSTADAFDSYISDPAHPVPYRHRPISPTYPGPGWPTWLVEDQRFVELRPDVATWQTAPLTEDLHIAGDLVAHLFASTTGSDTDWVVKLIDVYPEDYKPDPRLGGYELIIADEVFRGRYRNSFEHPEAITPNQITEYNIDLHTNSHAFLKGHRVMVQVQSTWFPIIDRNPQKFVPNIYKATDADYQPATQRIYRSADHASYILLPTVPASPSPKRVLWKSRPSGLRSRSTTRWGL